MKKYSILIREFGKVAVVRENDELDCLNTLFERDIVNGVDTEILDASPLAKYELLAVSHEKIFWSPATAATDPKVTVEAMSLGFVDLAEKWISIQE